MKTKSKNKIKTKVIKLRYLRVVEMPYSILSGADLSGLNLQHANFYMSVLCNADLTNSNLIYANLNYADLGNANLKGANIVFAELKGTQMTNCKIDRDWEYKLSEVQRKQVEWIN